MNFGARREGLTCGVMVARCYCAACGAELEAWFDVKDDDAAFERWRDTPCGRCGTTPRRSLSREALEHCPHCEVRFDPAALDDVLLHAFGACVEPEERRPATGIRGVRVGEPRGH